MVLAIQASHIAKSIIRNNTNRQLSMSTSQLLPHRHYLGNNSMELGLSRGGSEDLNNSGLGADSSDGMQQVRQLSSYYLIIMPAIYYPDTFCMLEVVLNVAVGCLKLCSRRRCKAAELCLLPRLLHII